VVVADAGYGQNADFRDGLDDRGIGYVLAVRSDVTVHPHDAQPTAPAWSGNGRKPQPRYRDKPSPVAVLAVGHGRQAFTEVTWREGSRGPMRSRFLALRVRPAGIRSRRLAQAVATAEDGHWDGVLPEVTLLAEWPEDAEAPTDYWLSNLPAGTPLAELVRLAKIRWRIEHDYRELKHGLGLTTSRAAPGTAGTTTSPWSPPPAPSSPNSAWPQKPIQRTHPLPDPRHHPRPAELLDRHLHHLPPPPAKNIHHQPRGVRYVLRGYPMFEEPGECRPEALVLAYPGIRPVRRAGDLPRPWGSG
jgi:hypothetical protein